MKRIFFLVLFSSIALFSVGQDENPFPKSPYPYNNNFTKFDYRNDVRFSETLRVPRWLSPKADTGMIAYSEGLIWYKDSTDTWIPLAKQEESGSVSLVTATHLTPLFTTFTNNATTTPQIQFTFQNAPGYKVFGRNSAFSGEPDYVTLDSNFIPGFHTQGYYDRRYQKYFGYLSPKTGKYLNLTKTWTNIQPYIFDYADTIAFAGNSWALEIFTSGTPWPTQVCNYFGKVKTLYGVNASDLNALLRFNWNNIKPHASTAPWIVDVTYMSAMGMGSTGGYSNGINRTKTLRYINNVYRAWIAHFYLDTGYYSVAALADPDFRNGVLSDSLNGKTGNGVFVLGDFSFTKPEGDRSVVIGLYGSDGERITQGTVTVSINGNEVYSRNMNEQNDANKGNSTFIKRGLNYDAIVLQDLDPAEATVEVTVTGDTVRFDYIGRLIPPENAKRRLFINNIGYGSSFGVSAIQREDIDSANNALQDAVFSFPDYPVFITNVNAVYDSTAHGTGHLGSAGNDIWAAHYINNLIPIKYDPVKPVATGDGGGGSGPSTDNLDDVAQRGNVSTVGIEVPGDTYGAGWNGSNEVPTKNDVYDKIESLDLGGGTPGVDDVLGQEQALAASRSVNLNGNNFSIEDDGVGLHIDQADGNAITAIGDYKGTGNGNFIGVDEATGKMYLKGGGIEGAEPGYLLEVLNPSTGEVKFAYNANSITVSHSLFADTIKAGSIPLSITNRAQIYDEFMAAINSAGGSNYFFDGSTGSNADASISTKTATGNVGGVAQLVTGTATNGTAYLGTNIYYPVDTANYYRFGIYNVNLSALSDGTDTYLTRFGFVLGETVQNEIYFKYTHTLNSGEWTCISENVNSVQSTASGVTVAASTDYDLEFEFKGTTIKFWINGTLVATHTTQVPQHGAANAIPGPSIALIKSAGTTSRTMLVDAVKVRVEHRDSVQN